MEPSLLSDTIPSQLFCSSDMFPVKPADLPVYLFTSCWLTWENSGLTCQHTANISSCATSEILKRVRMHACVRACVCVCVCETLMCLWTCLHRDSAPVIFPWSYRGGEKTSRSFSITPSPPLPAAPSPPLLWPLLAVLGADGRQSIQHLAAGTPVWGRAPSFPSHLSFALNLHLSSSFPSFSVLQPFHRSSRHLNWFSADHFTPWLFVLIVLSSPPPPHPHTHSPREAE